jgi:tryptophan-rich sensory protein
MWYKIKVYITSILIAVGTGLLASALTQGSMDIYSEFVKPPLAPPNILFPIVWTVLYVLMGISSAIIYLGKDKSVIAS